MKIAQLCALVAIMAVASSAPVHTQTPPQSPDPFFDGTLGPSFRAPPSPLACESHGIVYDGRTARAKPATRKTMLEDYDDAEEDARQTLVLAYRWAQSKKLRCAENCALSFYALPRLGLVEGLPVKQDPDYVAWDISYQCRRPPPVMLYQAIVPPPGGGASGLGGGANTSGTSASGSGTSATEDLCKKRQKKIDAIQADDEKAERAQRDVQSQIEAALSRGEEPSQDLIDQANALRNQRANNATWIKVLQKCEDSSLINSIFGDVSIGIGVGGGRGGSQRGRPNNTQPNNPGQNNQPPPPGNR
jgi:hypothetical protein